jgi:glyoxylase-like metal-dependent hydrolase (beta-lactamase superfamily II)
MNKVNVLIEGYAKEIEGGWIASSSVTLVENNGKRIIVDPGCNRPLLMEKLEERNLKTGDINFVFLTHSHTDHALLQGIFESAKVLNESEIYDDDRQVEHGGKIPETDLKIIETPGHDPDHCSLVVPTDDGTYVVAGDLFWWKDGEQLDLSREGLLSYADPYVDDMKVLRESREKVLEIADFIIPGHGKIFRVKK